MTKFMNDEMAVCLYHDGGIDIWRVDNPNAKIHFSDAMAFVKTLSSVLLMNEVSKSKGTRMPGLDMNPGKIW